MANNINDILFPSKVGGAKAPEKNDNLKKAGNTNDKPSEFEKELGLQKESANDIKVSTHAMKRLQERSITMDGDEFMKLRGAVDKLSNKGGKNSLVLTGKAAYIVDVPNSMIVTAMDKHNLSENVFTKIDSTLILE